MTRRLSSIRTLNEEVGEYHLPGGDLVVRARIALLFAWANDGKDSEQEIRTANAVSVLSLSGKSGVAQKRPRSEWKVVAEYSAKDAKEVSQAQSLYAVDGHLLLLRFVPVAFTVFDEFNHEGEPIVNVQSQTGILPIDLPPMETP